MSLNENKYFSEQQINISQNRSKITTQTLPGCIHINSVTTIVGDIGMADGDDGIGLGEVDCYNGKI